MSPDNARGLNDRHVRALAAAQDVSLPPLERVLALLRREQGAALEALLAPLPAAAVADLLGELSPADARLAWTHTPEDCRDDVLWEATEVLREVLLGNEEPDTESQMNAFALVEGRLKQFNIRGRRDLDGIEPIWIDLIGTSAAERDHIGAHYGLELPDPGEELDLEVSSRFHVEENLDIHLHSNFLLDREGSSRSIPVAFIIHDDILFSVRNEELPVFRLQRRRARTRPGYVRDCYDLLVDLYGADVEYSADSLEDIYSTLGKVGRQVLSEHISDEEAAAILADIAEQEDLNGRIRGNILDTQRALSFLMRCRLQSSSLSSADTRQILRDIESLNSHTSFLFDKINFLMDATIGFININQNRRVNQLTVLGVVFMPINILAGIGGMSEYSMMTQYVPWPLSYGAFIIGAGLLGWGTYIAVKFYERRRMRSTAAGVGRAHAKG